MSDFEFTRIYDTPEILLSMAVDNEMTFRGFRNAFFDQKALSPKQREGIEQRLRAATGNTGLGNALIGVLTNPLTYLTFITSPVGGSAASRMTADIFDVGKRAIAYADKTPLLAQWGLLPSATLLRGTPTGAAVRQIVNEMGNLHSEADEFLSPKLMKALEAVNQRSGLQRQGRFNRVKGGIKSFDPSRLRPDDPAQAVVQEINDLLLMRSEGFHRSVKQSNAGATREALINFDIDKRLRELGGNELVDFADGIQQSMFDRFVRLAGSVDKNGVFKADGRKIWRMTAGLQNPIFRDMKHKAIDGAEITSLKEMVHSLMDPQSANRLVNQIEKGKLDPASVQSVVTRELETYFNTIVNQRAYFPRNIPKFWDPRLQKYVDNPSDEFGKAVRSMTNDNSILGRQRNTPNYSPEDIERMAATIRRNGGNADGLDRLAISARSTQNKMRDKLKKEGLSTSGVENTLRFTDANVARGFHRYMQDTAGIYAMHVADVSEDVIAAQRTAYGSGKKVVEDFAKRGDVEFIDPGTNAKVGSYGKSFDSIKGPAQGFNLSDVILGDMRVMQNPYVRKLIPEFVVPSLSGRNRPSHTILDGIVNESKSALNTVVAGPFGDFLDKSGLSEFRKSLRHVSDPEFGVTGDAAQDFITKNFYASHLGLNLSSVILNLSQPFLLGPTVFGIRETLEAYPKALKEVFSYAKERASLGLRQITPAESDALIRKHFKYARESGITDDVFANIDSLSFDRIRRFEKATGMDRVFQISMGMFQQSEFLNRSVAAHAVTGRAARRGIRLSEDAISRQVAESVNLTQFGGGLLNTPLAFATQNSDLSRLGFLANPLMRQFFTFPMRQAVSVIYDIPRLGNAQRTIAGIETSSVPLALANDIMRATGVSAIAYEAGKGLVGADLSRGLFFESTLSVIGGSRFTQDESLPFVPPVVDIPLNLTRGFIGGDMAMLGQNIARTIPGGVALSRSLGALPEIPALKKVGLQRYYADYSAISEDGLIPVYDKNNRLVSLESPTELILKAGGADLQRFNDAGERDGFLLRNREEILNYKRRAAAFLLKGQPHKAKKISMEFQKTYGIPLQIDQDYLKAQAEQMRQTRTERVLQRLPSDVRSSFQSQLNAQSQNLGLRTTQGAVGNSATQDQTRTANLPPKVLEALQRIEAAEQRSSQTTFNSFQGFLP